MISSYRWHTDLFTALLDKHNARGNAILSALLYAFCPAAARWWLDGADPVVPFDPIWRSLSDYAQGDVTLKDMLKKYGFEGLLDRASDYVNSIKAYRYQHSRVLAPELTPMYPGQMLEVHYRHLYNEAIQNLGGKWDNFYAYIRTWAYCLQDWEKDLHISVEPEFSHAHIMLTVQGVRQPVRYPIWLWKLAHGYVRRHIIGMLAANDDVDILRFALARLSGPEGDKPWPSQPEVWALHIDGRATQRVIPFHANDVPSLIARLADLAQRGPHPPLTAFRSPKTCKVCGFFSVCYFSKNTRDELTEIALEFNTTQTVEVR